ncbi:MAG: sulfatase-like hydrolase/transferase [Verrucomicrobiales bacterium]|nr:sulfatase-like hydrolase/transferase [Verrucomicrobiales bacterium]
MSGKLIALGLLLTLSQITNGESKPNILIILADDLGYSDLGCYGSEIATPNLDSIAENGLRYTRFYNTARCWPTRGSLLTGFYAQQIQRDAIPGVVSTNQGTRPDWAPLLPDYLKPQGYRSYHTGKWHIDGMPIAEGFDRSYYLKDQSRFFSPQLHWKDDVKLAKVDKDDGFYGTVALADHVIEVLTEHAENYKEQPFFHCLAFAAPHFPLHALPEDIAIYEDTYREGWDVIRKKRWEKIQALELPVGDQLSEVEKEIGPPYHLPDHFEILGAGEVNKPLPWDDLTEQQKAFQSKKMAIHAAMIHRMDLEIGRVFEQIKKMGEWEDTLIMFLSDNGASAEIMVRGDGHDPAASPGSAETYLCLGPGWSTACNTPFRRHKTWTHEGGTSTPLIVSWPKGISAKGGLRTTAGHVIDVVPTLLELAGADDISGEGPAFPGKSLVPTFAADKPIERDLLWWYHDGHKAILKDGWKAVAANGGDWDLYDLNTDRAESEDRSGDYPEKVIELVKLWDEELAEFKALAIGEMSDAERAAAAKSEKNRGKMNAAQRAALPKPKQVLFNAEALVLEGRPAFIMKPETPGKPWVFYGPTLPGTPDKAESWMHQQFLDAGIAIAGIDVGEAYGSPEALPKFDALYAEMIERGFSTKPVLLGRSRGGLWVSSWAVENPDKVSALAGIYPVYDVTTYPGVSRAAPAYQLPPEELQKRLGEFNPIEKAAVLARAEIPVHIIHGEEDKVVPIKENSARLQSIYRDEKVADLITLERVKGQGHSYWPGYFNSRALVDFVIKHAKN